MPTTNEKRCSRMQVVWVAVAAVLVGFSLTLTPADAVAESDAEGGEANQNGFHLVSSLGLRAIPEGVSVANDLSYRWWLFEGDGLLVEDTYFETGLTTEVTPSNAWAGWYFQALPVAFLELRGSFQSINYFGTFGTLYSPGTSADAAWDLDAMPDGIGDGQPASGLMAVGTATPRAKLGPVVALAPFEYRWVSMNVDEPYYESTFDFLLAPTEHYWSATPTLGYVIKKESWKTWVLAGLGWEHTETIETGLTRDMARIVALWGLPWTLGKTGEMEAALLSGWWIRHPNRENSFYIAAQLEVDWAL